MRRVALWAVPRAVGTAFERVFLERDDTVVAHELFMPCHYYSSSRISSRYNGTVEAAPEYDYHNVKAALEQLTGKPILFLKEIAFHLEGLLETDYWSTFTHTFILRDPRISIPSLHKLMPDATLAETGFAGIAELFEIATTTYEQVPIVVNGDAFRRSPQETLRAYCALVGIPYQDTTTWATSEVVPEWRKWEDWHKEALTSTEIFPPPVDEPVVDLPGRVEDMIAEAMPYYEKVNRYAIDC